MTNMKHISEVPSGYLVRKRTNGHLHQRFFSDARYGNHQLALDAAMNFRDELLEEVSGIRSYQESNSRNLTGIVGVAWHLRENHHRNGAIVHSFRAQVSGDNGKMISRAWSVHRYGLWNAYEHAARWRFMVAFGRAMKASDIAKSFCQFMDNYLNEMREAKGSIRQEMEEALADMRRDESAPKQAISAISKFKSDEKPSLKVVSGNSRPAKNGQNFEDPLGIHASKGKEAKKQGT